MAVTTAIAPGGLVFRAGKVSAIWMRHYVAFRSGWVIESTAILLEPLFMLVAIGFGIGRFVDNIAPGFTYQEFVAPGVVVGSAMWHSLFSCAWGAYQRMQTHKVYETMLTAPVNLSELAAGEIVWGATRSIMTTVAVLAAAAALGLISSPWAVLVIAIGFLTGLVFGGMGLIYASIAPSTHSLTLIFTMIGTPLFFFSGAFFPIDSLPDFIEPLAWAMPLTPAVHVARGLSTAEFALSHLYSVLYLAGLAAVFYPIAIRLLRRRLLI